MLVRSSGGIPITVSFKRNSSIFDSALFDTITLRSTRPEESVNLIAFDINCRRKQKSVRPVAHNHLYFSKKPSGTCVVQYLLHSGLITHDEITNTISVSCKRIIPRPNQFYLSFSLARPKSFGFVRNRAKCATKKRRPYTPAASDLPRSC